MPSKSQQNRLKKHLYYAKSKASQLSSNCTEKKASTKKRRLENVDQITKRKRIDNTQNSVFYDFETIQDKQLTDKTAESSFNLNYNCTL